MSPTLPMEFLKVRVPILMRILLPGVLASGIFYPLVGWLLAKFPLDSGYPWLRIAVGAGLVYVLGALISIFTSHIYQLYEGTILWPKSLIRWATRRQEHRLKDYLAKAANAEQIKDLDEYTEAWQQIRSYPLDDSNQPVVTRPTRLGNILAGYEQYSDTRYGMDSVFYWPRIWVEMDKDKRALVDDQWAVADGFLLLAAISSGGGILWLLLSILLKIGWIPFWLHASSPGLAALTGLVLLATGYVFYWFSLPFHRQNGEAFKSVFDLYRSKIREAMELRPLEKETWGAAWAYLQYLHFVCPTCGHKNRAAEQTCVQCNTPVSKLAEEVRTTGKLPLHLQ